MKKKIKNGDTKKIKILKYKKNIKKLFITKINLKIFPTGFCP
jgi:hypothetical protein